MTVVIETAHNVFCLAPFIKFIVIFNVVHVFSRCPLCSPEHQPGKVYPSLLLFSLHVATSQLTVVFPSTFTKVVCHLSEESAVFCDYVMLEYENIAK